jgi:hypothetical protein
MLPELHRIVSTIDFDDDQESLTSSMADLSGDAASDEEGMTNDNDSQTSDDTTSDKDLMDADRQSMNESASDNDMAGEVASVDEGEDEEICTDRSCGTVGNM